MSVVYNISSTTLSLLYEDIKNKKIADLKISPLLKAPHVIQVILEVCNNLLHNKNIIVPNEMSKNLQQKNKKVILNPLFNNNIIKENNKLLNNTLKEIKSKLIIEELESKRIEYNNSINNKIELKNLRAKSNIEDIKTGTKTIDDSELRLQKLRRV